MFSELRTTKMVLVTTQIFFLINQKVREFLYSQKNLVIQLNITNDRTVPLEMMYPKGYIITCAKKNTPSDSNHEETLDKLMLKNIIQSI